MIRASGPSGRMAASRSVTTGSRSASTYTSATASAAAVSVSAMTSAIGWPTNRASSRASGSNIRMSSTVAIGRSAAVRTATTPGMARAAVASIERIRAWA